MLSRLLPRVCTCRSGGIIRRTSYPQCAPTAGPAGPSAAHCSMQGLSTRKLQGGSLAQHPSCHAGPRVAGGSGLDICTQGQECCAYTSRCLVAVWQRVCGLVVVTCVGELWRLKLAVALCIGRGCHTLFWALCLPRQNRGCWFMCVHVSKVPGILCVCKVVMCKHIGTAVCPSFVAAVI